MVQKFIANLSDKEKKVFYIALLVVSLALLDRLFLGPVLDRLKTIDDEISQQKNIIDGDLKILSQKDRILQKSEVFSKYYTDIQQDDDVVITDFLSKVEQLAAQSKVNLVKSNPSETNSQKDYTEYFANLDCVGSLKDVLTFMHKVNSSEDLFKIIRFNMTPKRGAEDEVNASMTIVKLIVSPYSSSISSTP